MTKRKQKRLVSNVTIFLLMFMGCTTNQLKQEENLSLKLFSIQNSILKSDSIINESDDGRNGMIVSENLDTIYFNFGYDIDNLSEKDPAVIYYPHNEEDIRNNLDTALVDPRKIVYTNKPNFDIDEFRKQNVFFDTVSGLHAKITVPRRVGRGITGVYIDSIKSDAGGRLKFNFYATNLDSAKQERMLRAIRSIELKMR